MHHWFAAAAVVDHKIYSCIKINAHLPNAPEMPIRTQQIKSAAANKTIPSRNYDGRIVPIGPVTQMSEHLNEHSPLIPLKNET